MKATRQKGVTTLTSDPYPRAYVGDTCKSYFMFLLGEHKGGGIPSDETDPEKLIDEAVDMVTYYTTIAEIPQWTKIAVDTGGLGRSNRISIVFAERESEVVDITTGDYL